MKLSMRSINERSSIRNYSGEPLPAEARRALEAAFAEALPCPFGRSPRFALAGDEESGLGGGKIGTYGVIAGARTFIVGVVEKGELACVDFGYALEGVVLRATELGLGTCWIGGAFDRGKLRRLLGAAAGEFVPAITPVGVPADREGAAAQLIRRAAGSAARKAPEELFLEAEASGGLPPLGAAGDWAPVLEAVRIGPSASNKQPWRLVVDRRGGGDALHLLMEENRLYNNLLGATKLQELDMGIAMRHVEVAAAESGIRGAWRRRAEAPVAVEGVRRYMASFERA